MGVILGLAAALAYGASDFVAGVLSRRASFVQVAVIAQLTAMVCTLLALPLTSPASIPTSALAWGLASGVGAAVGTLALYRGLGAGRMAVVAPLSGIGSAALPAVAGFVLGERPSYRSVIGIVLALPAVWLVSTGDNRAGTNRAGANRQAGAGEQRLAAGVVDGLLSGVGFALMFVGLDQAGADSGLWPVAVSQVSASAILCTWAITRRIRLQPDRGMLLGAATVGILGGAASILFLLATHASLLALAAVLTSLYPAVTVLLARITLGERLGRLQMMGLGVATIAVALIVSG